MDRKPANPVYVRLLIAALVLYVAGMTWFVTELYYKVITLEHEMVHVQSGGATCRH